MTFKQCDIKLGRRSLVVVARVLKNAICSFSSRKKLLKLINANPEQAHKEIFTDNQGWVMRPFAQTNARMIRTIRVFNVNASAFRGHF